MDTEDIQRLIGDPRKAHDDLTAFRKAAIRLSSSQHPRMIQKYPNKWVAVTKGKVRAHGDSYDAVMQQVREKGLPRQSTIIRFIEKEPRTMIL